MNTRQLSLMDVSTAPATRDLTLRTPPNWTAICFFAFLGVLHLSIAIPAFYHGRWEGFLSLVFGVIFVNVALLCWLVRSDLTIEQSRRRIRLRTGFRRLCIERFIPFQSVHGVRLMMMPGKSPSASSIELLCDNEDIQCPPTDIPRQQALCLAMTMNVRLIKVLSEDVPDCAERLDPVQSDRI
ncbi:MAG TPA: hypothetical protein VGR35_08695 [Tepidisphaeraceae bacterium]|nr:hypothetical protein [Tepidisphaeraceae bacterium]